MIKVLVAGNSHVAALKLGWEQIQHQYGSTAQVDFFAMPDPGFKSFEFVGPRCFGLKTPTNKSEKLYFIRTRDFNGTARVLLRDYDHVVLAGHNFAFRKFLNGFYKKNIEGLYEAGFDNTISIKAAEALAHAQIDEFWPIQGWQKLRNPKITLLARPRPSADALHTPAKPNSPIAWYYRDALVDPTPLKLLHDWFDDIVVARIAKTRMHYIPQPAETIAPSGLTLSEWGRGSPKLTKTTGHEDADTIHMNGEYGALSMRYVVDGFLAEAAATSPQNATAV